MVHYENVGLVRKQLSMRYGHATTNAEPSRQMLFKEVDHEIFAMRACRRPVSSEISSNAGRARANFAFDISKVVSVGHGFLVAFWVDDQTPVLGRRGQDSDGRTLYPGRSDVNRNLRPSPSRPSSQR